MKPIKNKTFRWKFSKFIIVIYILIAVFAPFIANDKAIFCLCNGKFVFMPQKEEQSLGFCLPPLIPYSPKATNVHSNVSISPFSDQSTLGYYKRHWLGTDKLGRDVTSGLIHGTNISMKIGFLSVILAFIFGVSVGMFSGYLKNDDFKVSLLEVSIGILSFLLLVFYMAYEWSFSSLHIWNGIGMIAIFFLFNYSLYLISSKLGIKRQIHFPLDTIVVKLIEIRKSFPGLFLLLALTSLISSPNIYSIILTISLLIWTDFARYARAETLAVSQENYITSAKILGFSKVRIVFRHIFPNILPTLIVAACFSISGALLLESTLSYLGLGLPLEDVSWGKMMAEGRNMSQWWLVVFPGIALFLLIFSLNTIAETWTENQIYTSKSEE